MKWQVLGHFPWGWVLADDYRLLSVSEGKLSPPTQRQRSCVQMVTRLISNEKNKTIGRGEKLGGHVLKVQGLSELTRTFFALSCVLEGPGQKAHKWGPKLYWSQWSYNHQKHLFNHPAWVWGRAKRAGATPFSAEIKTRTRDLNWVWPWGSVYHWVFTVTGFFSGCSSTPHLTPQLLFSEQSCLFVEESQLLTGSLQRQTVFPMLS